jgi:hypothetical protein
MAAEREKMYECEVRRRRVKVGGGYEPFWKVKNVAVRCPTPTPSSAAKTARAR